MPPPTTTTWARWGSVPSTVVTLLTVQSARGPLGGLALRSRQNAGHDPRRASSSPGRASPVMGWRGSAREPTSCAGRVRASRRADELRGLVPGVSAILSVAGDRIDAALLEAAGPSLRVVGLASAGYDSVDRAAAAARGVVVTNTPGVLEETTADLAFALILMARRRLGEAAESLRAGRWNGLRHGRLPRAGRARSLARDHRLRPDRPRCCPAGAWLRDAGPALQPLGPERRGVAGGRPRHPARGVGRRVGPRTAQRGDPASHRRPGARQDEADGHPGEHRTRSRRR